MITSAALSLLFLGLTQGQHEHFFSQAMVDIGGNCSASCDNFMDATGTIEFLVSRNVECPKVFQLGRWKFYNSPKEICAHWEEGEVIL